MGTYITNPPSAVPAYSEVSPSAEGFTPPAGYTCTPECKYPGLSANTLVLQTIREIVGFVSADHLSGVGSTFANQQVIDDYNARCIAWQEAQLAAWNAAGQPATFTPTTPAPVAPTLPCGDFEVIWDPTVPGQAWLSPQSTTTPAGACPQFVPPVPEPNMPYLKSFAGIATIRGKKIAVFTLIAGKDTVTSDNPNTTLVAGMTYGDYTYDGEFGELLNVTKQFGPFGASYYYSAAPVA